MKKQPNLIFFAEVSLAEGFLILAARKRRTFYMDESVGNVGWVSACSGWPVFSCLRAGVIQCWKCGTAADRWIATKGRRDHLGLPVLNVYGTRADGRLVLMNRDHIIPKSLGGTEDLANLRPSCETCNSDRGNKLSDEDLLFQASKPNVVSMARFNAAKESSVCPSASQISKNGLALVEASLDKFTFTQPRQTTKESPSAADLVLLEGAENLGWAARQNLSLRWINSGNGFEGPYVNRLDLKQPRDGVSTCRGN